MIFLILKQKNYLGEGIPLNRRRGSWQVVETHILVDEAKEKTEKLAMDNAYKKEADRFAVLAIDIHDERPVRVEWIKEPFSLKCIFEERS